MPATKAPAKPSRPLPAPTGADLVDQLLVQLWPRIAHGYWSSKKIKLTDAVAGRAILAGDRQTQAAAVAAVVDHLYRWNQDYAAYAATLGPNEVNGSRPEWEPLYNRRCLFEEVLRVLLRRSLPLTEATVVRLVAWPLGERGYINSYGCVIPQMTGMLERRAAERGLGRSVRGKVARLARALRGDRGDRDGKKYADRLDRLIGGRGGRR